MTALRTALRTTLPFAPRRRGTALLTVLLGRVTGPALAQAASGSGQAPGSGAATGQGGETGGGTSGAGPTGTGMGGSDGRGMSRGGRGTGR